MTHDSWSVPGALVAGEAGECRAQIPGDGDRVDVAGPALVAVDQVHHGRAAEAAERQAEVERRARDHDHVGLRLRQAQVRLAASGWSAGAAAALPVEEVGTRRCSTTATSSASAPAHHTSVPATSIGRSAPAMSRAAAATWSGSGSAAEGTAARRDRRLALGEHHVDRQVDEHRSPVRRQRRGGRLVDHRGMSSTAATVRASLVTGASRGTWSSSCSEPDPQRACGARPPRTTTAER